MSNLFKPHGHFRAEVRGRILIAHTSGHWNIEKHQEMSIQSAQLAQCLDAGGPWASVVVTHDTLVTSLEVLDAGRKAVADRIGISQLAAVAWVIRADVEGYDLLSPRYEALYEGLLPTAVFEDVDTACQWVNGVLRLSV